ncbi:MAG: Crp/Fnr family transcriptional regulator [Pseudonocardiales bacterium]|nr:MAG: Crp/Fnr family transcriptional regulator [Pseudonocardiales bacterium]
MVSNWASANRTAPEWLNGTLMARLTEEVGQELLSLASPRQYPGGAVLVNQGDPSTHVYLLETSRPRYSACVKVTATLKNGSESLLGIRVSGDLVGEIAALRNGTRTATVTTCTPTVAHAISRTMFLAFLRRHEDAWEATFQMMADRLDWANCRRLEFTGYDVPVRLARVILELLGRHGYQQDGSHELGVQLSQAEFGKLIGAKPDIVGQAMRQLRSTGLLRLHYRGATITDLHALRAFADPA